MKILLALTIGAAVFAWARVLVRGRATTLQRRVEAHVAHATRQVTEPAAVLPSGGRGAHALDRLERGLERRTPWKAFEARVARAGIDRRPVELFVAVAAATLVLFLVALLAGSAAYAIVVLAAPTLGTWLVLGVLAQRRLRAFDDQLPDLLSALGSSLRAGHGFLQSLQAVAHDAPEPAGKELRRALAETRVGKPVDEALGGIVERLPSRDFEYVLTAIAVQRQSGGSLASLFEMVNDTVRARHQFVRKVRALTATGRMSAYSLLAMPIGVALLISLVNPGYLSPMFHSHGGRLMLALGASSMAVGTLLVRRIVAFKG